MLDFFKTLFRPVPPSGTTAKERLRLVLLSDHLSLAPDVIESLKRDLLDVISRYVEIDPAHADVTFEQRESEVAMLASIPITGVRARERPAPPTPAPVAAPPAATAAPAPTQEAPELALALTEPAAAPASPGPAAIRASKSTAPATAPKESQLWGRRAGIDQARHGFRLKLRLTTTRGTALVSIV